MHRKGNGRGDNFIRVISIVALAFICLFTGIGLWQWGADTSTSAAWRNVALFGALGAIIMVGAFVWAIFGNYPDQGEDQ